MYCPICKSSLVMTGLTIWKMSSNPEVSPALQHTYLCTNQWCESTQGSFCWTHNGETFFMHHLETHQEEAA